MNTQKPDFIIQMGDFCRLLDQNRSLLDELRNEWGRFKGPAYHVIGNHDMDGGFTRDHVVEFWKSEGKYYSFDINHYHFIVLDGNEGERSDCRRYPSTFTDEQLSWLENDLDKTSLPVIVFVHQGLDNDSGVENADAVRWLLEAANKKSGSGKVHVVFSGHHHKDYYNLINGIHYVQINSMSYSFLGKKYMAASYSEDVLAKYPKVRELAPYKDPLWTMVEIDVNGRLTLAGKKSVFIGPSPRERGMSKFTDIYPAVPYISDRKLNL